MTAIPISPVLACSATIASTPAVGRSRCSSRRPTNHATSAASTSAAQPRTIPMPTSALTSSRAMLKNVTNGITP